MSKFPVLQITWIAILFLNVCNLWWFEIFIKFYPLIEYCNSKEAVGSGAVYEGELITILPLGSFGVSKEAYHWHKLINEGDGAVL